MPPPDDFDAAVRRHDAALASRGLAIWVGSEPTFTDRHAQSPEWLYAAEGDDKRARAHALLCALAAKTPGGFVLRSAGRKYPGEDAPRFSVGVYARRDATPIWVGPPDPMLAPGARVDGVDVRRWARAMCSELAAIGRPAVARLADESGAFVVATPGGFEVSGDLAFRLAVPAPGDPSGPRVELPGVPDVSLWSRLIGCVGRSARSAGLRTLIVAGAPPPVDDSVAWTTVTPDPAVVEVNTAPSADASEFLRRSRLVYAAAAAQGLAAYRLRYNGMVADSGGGGQVTLGGPSPDTSPFVLEPRLLPRLVRFCHRHPSLSYLFSHDFVGSGGQSVRADERGPDAFDDLELALALVDRDPDPSPERAWQCLAPLLTDAVGNPHRAEINVEKLRNPNLPGRGNLGLVEFRALRMQHTPERATAIACLLRALAAMLMSTPDATPLLDWGRVLHDRFALPFHLERDLIEVLDTLARAGFGLDDPIAAQLRRDEFRAWATVALPAGTLEVRRALEFWPLLGDASSPEQAGTSRLVDASTTRVELRWRHAQAADSRGAAGPDAAGEPARVRVRVRVDGLDVPMHEVRDELGRLAVGALRYRHFTPHHGLHPTLGSQAPVRLRVQAPGSATGHEVTLHDWRPDDEAYPGLPEDLDDAARRRAERVTVREVPAEPSAGAAPEGTRPGDDWCLDLRRPG